ncbi:MAG: MerR family transcriptional regulator [Flavobacteriales bacterium]|nr:MerR family transcriptional regulator [Flavobacteriales bacterium]|tara:strand:- start:991 stop:1329 length:339 start_codon:yes stop_codon:yes gene_type:complete
MQENKETNEKIYYSIGEVSKIIGISTSKIRFWEKEFDSIKPKKNKKGNRIFNKKELNKLKLIHHLLKEKKYTIDGAKKKMRKNPEKTETHQKVIENLKKIKAELIEIRKNLN